MTAAPTPPKLPDQGKPMPKWQRDLLQGLWNNAVKPKLDAAFVTLKAKLLDALKGQPLITIGGAVAAIDAFLLNGPKPKSGKSTKFLTDARKALGDVQITIDKILAPPKPISSGLRKALAGVVTVAGLLGIWSRVVPVNAPVKAPTKP